ncbi:MAG: Vi polysaccharide biosynthesis protein VipB/TviC [Candidatus Aminicenantes bacterium RBG_16_63_16]|nr:MAG: Vi polysaccharide biosynthesis protein VipB/TviC [Candidatus Aminicenantes bacterium RBG_16_63_16]
MRFHLVTGGAGFIGSHIVEELVRRGDRVRVLDNFLTGKRDNIAPFLDRIELLEGDIRDSDACRRAVEGVDDVLHQAALPSVPRSIENPVLSHDINVNGTLNLLRASLEAKVGKFVFASSSSVYGDERRLPQIEGQEGNVLSPYALGKKVGEMYGSLFFKLYGLKTISLRYFNVFGPRQDPFSQYAAAVPLFVTKFFSGQSPTIFGDGEQSRDFTFVANVVEANLRALDAPPDASGEVFNIACGERLSVNALAAEIKRLTAATAAPVHAGPRPGEIRHSFADISKAARLLGYTPLRSLRDGLAETVQWYRGRS